MKHFDAFCAAVDEIVAWPPFRVGRMAESTYRESARRLLDGAWIGAYAQPDERSAGGWMIVELRQTGFILDGEGYDPVGAFAVKGTVDDATGQVDFQKTYVGGHGVAYSGLLGDEAMHGKWTLQPTRRSGVWALRAARSFDDDTIEALGERARGVVTEGLFGVTVAPSAPPGRVHALVRDFLRLR
jgi:hypothetical protein